MELIWDKANCTIEHNGITITASPRSHPPFTVVAIVEEQDTYLLLGETTVLNDPGKPAWYLANTLENEKPYPQGHVIIKGRGPLRLLAVLHDINNEPTYQPNIVKQCYQAVLQTVRDKHLESFALPPLGTVHGKLTINESVQLLAYCLRKLSPIELKRIWLILPVGSDCQCLSLLQQQ